jgi:hypothetical protein
MHFSKITKFIEYLSTYHVPSLVSVGTVCAKSIITLSNNAGEVRDCAKICISLLLCDKIECLLQKLVCGMDCPKLRLEPALSTE